MPLTCESMFNRFLAQSLIPSTRRRNVRPTEPHPADFVTVYMNDEDLPLPIPPRPDTTSNVTNEAESSSDLTRG